jgi:hypothetical protein
MENKDVNHVLLSCPKSKELKMQFINKKYLYINEELACRKIE